MALTRRSVARPLRTVGAALGAGMLVALLAAAAPAGADEDSTAPTLAAALSGDVAGLTAVAVTDETSTDMAIEVRFENTGDDPVDVAIPFGTLVVTPDEGDQTMAVNPPDDPDVVEVAASGGTPTIEVPEGDSIETLPVYCTELGDSYPFTATPVTPIDPAADELAAVLRAGVAQQVDHDELQAAVWWLTDEPDLPVTGPDAALLADVDVEAFAADPHLVTPDTGYTPMWMRDETGSEPVVPPADVDDEEAAAILDERFDGPATPAVSDSDPAGSAGTLLWVLVIAAVVVGAMAITTRAATRPRARPVEVGRTAAGWYPDPWGAGRRYWDGRAWTDRTS